METFIIIISVVYPLGAALWASYWYGTYTYELATPKDIYTAAREIRRTLIWPFALLGRVRRVLAAIAEDSRR